MPHKRTHPKFRRPNYGRSSRSRIKDNWRGQRGIDNKKRLKIKYMGASPSIGYGQPAAIKGMHPSGLPEALVQSPSELQGLRNVAVRIASGVGKKKREQIIQLAEAAKLPVLNRSKKHKTNEKKQITAASEAKKAEQKERPAQQEQVQNTLQ